jgi:hypothetical protein
MIETEPRIQNSEYRMAEVLRRSEELLAVLETDALHMRESLSLLDRMRGLVIKHDESGLQEMLQQIRAKADAYAAAESQRQRLRRQLAVLLDCPLGELTLSRLAAALRPPLRDRAVRQRTVLRDLAERLRREHRSTALLLADCVRFNRALFRAIFHQGKAQPVVYGATGVAKPMPSGHLMNVQF